MAVKATEEWCSVCGLSDSHVMQQQKTCWVGVFYAIHAKAT
jgi:hypothetical protein